MSPESRGAIIDRTEEKIARERAEVEYVIGVVEGHEDTLRAAYVPEGTPEDEVGLLLFDHAMKVMKWVEHECTKIAGVAFYSRKPGDTGASFPEVQLGWATFNRIATGSDQTDDDGNVPYVLSPTAEAREVVDGLRAIQSKSTMREERAKRTAKMDEAIANAARRSFPGPVEATTS